MIELALPHDTLADAYTFLEKGGYSIIKSISYDQLQQLVELNEHFNEPTHQYVKVFLDKQSKKEIYLVHSNLGYMYFNTNEYLDDYRLDNPFFYFNYKIDGHASSVHAQEVVFTDNGKPWKGEYDFEIILDHFGLNGEDDYAPFSGFYILE